MPFFKSTIRAAAAALVASASSLFSGWGGQSPEVAIMEMEALSLALAEAAATGRPMPQAQWSNGHFHRSGGAHSHHHWKTARASGRHDFRRTVHA